MRNCAVLPPDHDYCRAVAELWAHQRVQSMSRFPQHGDTSCLLHCLRVSYLSYRYCKARRLNAWAAARGGLLHDLFLYDWHTYRCRKGESLHGFSHPRKALTNAREIFRLTPVEEDIILHHMWPLTWPWPSSPEARVVMLFDKYVSLLETLRFPVRLKVPGAI